MSDSRETIMLQVVALPEVWKEIRNAAGKNPSDATLGDVEPFQATAGLQHLPFSAEDVKKGLEIGILMVKFGSALLAFLIALSDALRAELLDRDGKPIDTKQLSQRR